VSSIPKVSSHILYLLYTIYLHLSLGSYLKKLKSLLCKLHIQNHSLKAYKISFFLCSFDERISTFAEEKFKRDGIEVQTGCRVLSVSDKDITMKMKSNGEICSIPHGLVLWSTGIGTRPVVKDFMEQIGQVCYIILMHLHL
jgi:hypothetical protein